MNHKELKKKCIKSLLQNYIEKKMIGTTSLVSN